MSREVIAAFRSAVPGGWVRGYVSTAFECPYWGPMDRAQTAKVAGSMVDAGVDELSIADTIGVAVPADVKALLPRVLDAAGSTPVACHFHDTRGTAIANVATALEMGISAFDASAGGLGGCPYAPGAGGNLATEDLVYFLERTGFRTGIDLRTLARASLPILRFLGRAPASKAQQAALAARDQTE